MIIGFITCTESELNKNTKKCQKMPWPKPDHTGSPKDLTLLFPISSLWISAVLL